MVDKELLEPPNNLETEENTIKTAILSSKDCNQMLVDLTSPEMDSLLEDTLNHVEPAKKLTNREAQILRLIIEGNTNKKIAEKLYRTERTVEYHRNRLMRKLEAKSVIDLVKRSIAMGLL
jgi:DNA-binding NarL/FixJ family response regulator